VAVPFYENIVGNFIVYQDHIETNLLQLLAQPETSDWLSIIFGIIFDVQLVTIFFLQIYIAFNHFTAFRCPTAVPASLIKFT